MSIYDECRACMKLVKRLGEYSGGKTELRQGFLMSLCPFNVFLGRVVRPVNKKATGKSELRDGSRGGLKLGRPFMQMM